MKNKIAFKLTVYFSAALIMFAIIIGIIFVSLFKNNAVNLHKTEMENRALTIADTISELTEGSGLNFDGMRGKMGMNGMMTMRGGIGTYLRNIDDIAMSDAWVVDEDLNLLTTGTMAHMNYSYADLPEDADSVVREVFNGVTTFSEGFSDLLDSPTITVGTPIKSGNEIIGALLLHSPVKGIDEGVKEGYKILVLSILVSLVLSIILSTVLAVTFVKPLKNMKDIAFKLAQGQYSARTEVNQNDEIGELANTLDWLSHKLYLASLESENLQKQRQEFISNISHELRTPVTVIRGSLEALCDGIIKDPEKISEYYMQMLSESKGLERLVNDLLELSRLQNTDFKIETENVNIFDILEDVVRSASKIAQSKNIKIEYVHDTNLLIINGDYGRLRQMFMVVVDNAIKFSKENETVSINISKQKVIIKDTGIGISKENLPHIFDRYFKDESDNNKTGTGLGLTIAKQIALRHGINLTAASEQNKGTSFIFDLSDVK